MDIIAIFIVTLLIFVGVLTSFIPIIPGILFIWLGILFHKVWFADASITWMFFWITTGLAVFSQIIDYALSYWGARRFGASIWSGLGAVVGVIIMPFLLTPLIGFILGPILGAITGELLAGNGFRSALKAGTGTVIGGFLAFTAKMGISLFIISWFVYSIFNL